MEVSRSIKPVLFPNEGASPMADELSLIEKKTDDKNVYFQVTAV